MCGGMPERKWQEVLADPRLAQKVRSARRVGVLTGAGISAESGIPTFRGEQGLWKKFRPEELANFDAFMANPTLVWEWYRFRRDIVRKAQPNAGHRALAAWETKIDGFTLITQNVDGLHRRAGSRNIIELHGNLERDRCLECRRICEADDERGEGPVPQCQCGGRLRPDVVWYGEVLPEGAMERATDAAWQSEVFLTVGTSAVVYPAASLPFAAKRQGALLVEVNPEPTPVSEAADYSLFGPAGEVLPALVGLFES